MSVILVAAISYVSFCDTEYSGAIMCDLAHSAAMGLSASARLQAERQALAVSLNTDGVNFFKAGRLSDSVKKFREAVRANPDMIVAHQNLALALAGCGQHQDACVVLKDILRLSPGNQYALGALKSLQPLSHDIVIARNRE